MKISSKVLEQYQELCPISSMKCENDIEDLKYKIQRCVDLGKPIRINGKLYIRYYHLNFRIKGNMVESMHADKTEPIYNIPHMKKHNYNNNKRGQVNLVFAGDHKEYLEFINENNLNKVDYTYVYEIRHIKGVKEAFIHEVGEYEKNRAWQFMMKKVEFEEAV